MITLMDISRKAALALLLALVVFFTVACNDWDGANRSGWEAEYTPPTRPAPTPRATPPNVRPGDEDAWRAIWGSALQSG